MAKRRRREPVQPRRDADSMHREHGRLRPHIWVQRHLQVFFASLGRLSRRPLGTLMTAAVIGVAVALPAGLLTLVDNVRELAGGWEGGASISVFLRGDLEDTDAEALAKRLRTRVDISRVKVITREQALAEFRRQSGFGEALDLLDHNPLPALLLITPAASHSTPEWAEKLAKELHELPQTDFAQVDLQWVRRLAAITEALQRGVLVLAVLLALAVLLIIGNTVRLEIQNRHAEIEIAKLVGATNAFIRRPFLYEGTWYGLLGGLIAGALLIGAMASLSGPVQRLAGLYQSEFALSGVPLLAMLGLLAGSALLGLLGAWLAVGRHLSAIEPGEAHS